MHAYMHAYMYVYMYVCVQLYSTLKFVYEVSMATTVI
jgi:hypothetical protein